MIRIFVTALVSISQNGPAVLLLVSSARRKTHKEICSRERRPKSKFHPRSIPRRKVTIEFERQEERESAEDRARPIFHEGSCFACVLLQILAKFHHLTTRLESKIESERVKDI